MTELRRPPCQTLSASPGRERDQCPVRRGVGGRRGRTRPREERNAPPSLRDADENWREIDEFITLPRKDFRQSASSAVLWGARSSPEVAQRTDCRREAGCAGWRLNERNTLTGRRARPKPDRPQGPSLSARAARVPRGQDTQASSSPRPATPHREAPRTRARS